MCDGINYINASFNKLNITRKNEIKLNLKFKTIDIIQQI